LKRLAIAAAAAALLAACSSLLGIDDRSLDPQLADASASESGAGSSSGTSSGSTSSSGGAPDGSAVDGAASDAGVDAFDAFCAADTSADPMNCGACGHGCLGGGCYAHQCLPVPIATVTYARGLATDGVNLYIDDMGSVAVDDAAVGSIDTCSVGGCDGSVNPIAPSQPRPFALAIDDTSVYWLNAGLPALGTGSTLATCEKSGCVPHTYGPNELDAIGLTAADPLNLYWSVQSDGGAIRTCAKSVCTPSTFATDPAGQPAAIAVDATNVYWAVGQKIHYCPIAQPGCSPLELVFSANAESIVADSTGVYWTDQAHSAIGTCPPGGCGDAGGLERFIGSSEVNPTFLAVDDTFVYWTDSTTVRRALKTGSPPYSLASIGGAPRAIAVDGVAVYWIENDTVMRLAK
jgi:hypothetical protein